MLDRMLDRMHAWDMCVGAARGARAEPRCLQSGTGRAGL